MGIFLDNIAAAPVPNKFINKPIKRITTGFNAYKQTFFDFLRTDKENKRSTAKYVGHNNEYGYLHLQQLRLGFGQVGYGGMRALGVKGPSLWANCLV